MIVFPTALMLAVGLVLSLRGKGTPWCAFLALTLGIVIANTAVGEAFMEVVEQAVAAVSTTGTALAR